MTDNVNAAKALLDGVTPGPWTWESESGDWASETLEGTDSVLWWDFDLGFRFGSPADARFIAEARSLIPEMLAEIVSLRCALANCKE